MSEMTPAIAKLKQTRAYSVTATAEQIRLDVEDLRGFDKHHEKIAARWGWGVFFSILLAVAGFFLLLWNEGLNVHPALGGSLIGLGVLSASVCQFVKWTYLRWDLEDFRYELLLELVRLLQTDMAQDAQFQVKVDFSPHNSKQFFMHKGVAGHWTVKYYAHPWFEISGQLLDGSKFQVALLEKQQDRHRYKTNARGKTKLKTKTKNGGEATVSLRIKPRRYPRFAQTCQIVQHAVRLPSGALTKGVVADGDRLTVRAKHGPEFYDSDPAGAARRRGELVATMMLSCYHVLNQSRQPREAS